MNLQMLENGRAFLDCDCLEICIGSLVQLFKYDIQAVSENSFSSIHVSQMQAKQIIIKEEIKLPNRLLSPRIRVSAVLRPIM